VLHRCAFAIVVQWIVLSIFAIDTTRGEEPRLDVPASTIRFVGTKDSGKHLGGFRKFDADVNMDGSQVRSVQVNIDMKSVHTDNWLLSGQLKRGSFFDVRKFPKATFRSTRIEENQIVGHMTLHGVTREMTLPAKFKQLQDGVQIDTAFALDRTKFGITVFAGMIHDDVKVRARLVFSTVPPDSAP
jgi:polyisoprenoid-binding protein YceI